MAHSLARGYRPDPVRQHLPAQECRLGPAVQPLQAQRPVLRDAAVLRPVVRAEAAR
ncbi:MAG: hypothetical protein NTW28_37535 [Candidatus Solibacter sp.]|nr:hypothetical protein [Candidatus Solibacter sp.]